MAVDQVMTSQDVSTRPYGLPSQLMYDSILFQNTVGEGQYGSVWKCMDRTTGEMLACKQMSKAKHPKSVERETTCFVRVQGHHNVVQLRQLYEDQDSVFFLMELCDAGDLLPLICNSGGLQEDTSSAIFWQLVEAVDHCHSRGVIHRDIKPENVLLNKPGPDGVPQVKLADFGLATWVKPGGMSQGWVGSPPYEAPEVVELRPYDSSADVWSLGVVLYGMLSANWPSFAQGRKFNRRIDFQAPVWQGVSVQAKALIIRMLATNPAERPTCADILGDPWFAMMLPDRVHMHSKARDSFSTHLASSALPVDSLPALCLPPPAVAPYKVLPAGKSMGTAPDRESRKPVKVLPSRESIGNWLEEDEKHDQEGARTGTECLPRPRRAWNALSLSRTISSSNDDMVAPDSGPCSNSSTSSAPASPEAKAAVGEYSAGSVKGAAGDSLLQRGGSFTRCLGKKLLQMVSETLNGNPMHTKPDDMGPQDRTCPGTCHGQDMQRPSASSGPCASGVRAR